MLKNLALRIHVYYILVLTLMLAIFSYGGYFYFENGFLNNNYISSLFESNYIFKELVKTGTIDSIKTNIEKFNIRSAQRDFLTLDSNLLRIRQFKKFNSKENTLLDQNEKAVKEQFNKLTGYPEMSALLNVLMAKMNRFNEIVTNRKWATLSRIASRIKIKLNQDNFSNVNKLREISDFVIKDFKQMKLITENSTLKNEDKVFILNQLENMNTEIIMLDNYVNDLRKLNQDFDYFSKEFKEFLKTASPAISLERIDFDNKVRYVYYFGLAIFVIFLSFIFISLLLIPLFGKSIKKKVANSVLNIINEQLIPVTVKNEFTDLNEVKNFQDEFDKSRKYVQKRMNFGQIFQESLPFASILLDSNLKVIWSNNHFFEILNLELVDSDKENLTWDYLARFTNLGDNDPVLDCFKSNMSGVFQLKVKPRAKDKAVPYELYACPTSVNDQKRLMLIFYPLSYLEDTIANQSLCLIRPVEKSLKILNQNIVASDEFLEMKTEFENAEIGNLYELLNSLVDKVISERNVFVNESDSLEAKLKDQYKIIKDVEKFNDRNIDLQLKIAAVLNNIKDNIVQLIDSNEEQVNLKLNWAEKNIDFMEQFKHLMVSFEDQSKRFENTLNSFNALTKHRSGIKEIKSELDSQREKIIQTLDQTLIHQKSVNIDPLLLEQSFNKIKFAVKSLEKTITTLDKTMVQFDVSISKIEMEMQGKLPQNEERLQLERYKITLQNYAEISKNSNESIISISQNAHYQEDKIVAYIKDLYGQIRKCMEHLKSVQTLAFSVNDIFFDKKKISIQSDTNVMN
ncbi:MAG: hypothetical protein U0T83_00590 [Bacteriovoracaceae bacterium]